MTQIFQNHFLKTPVRMFSAPLREILFNACMYLLGYARICKRKIDWADRLPRFFIKIGYQIWEVSKF